MPFVRRNAAGAVESLHRSAAEVPEFLPEHHPDVLAFLAEGRAPAGDDQAAARPAGEAGGQFAALDADFVRVIEDVIDTLISKNVINITDLPLEAQTKLFGRKGYRERRAKDALKLFGDDEGL